MESNYPQRYRLECLCCAGTYTVPDDEGTIIFYADFEVWLAKKELIELEESKDENKKTIMC